MKKYLVITVSWLLPITAQAAEFIGGYDLSASGYYGYSEYADKYRTRYKHNHTPGIIEAGGYAGYAFADESELRVHALLQLSSGKEVEDYNQGKWGENLYLTYASDYGELSIGQIYNAAYQMAVGAPSVGAFKVNNTPLTDFIANPNWQRNDRRVGYRTLNSTYLNTDGEAIKVSYITPELHGSKLAFSFTPDSYSRAGLINKRSRYENKSSYAAGMYSEFDLWGLQAETSLGYAYNHRNNQEISAGASFYRKGWTLGGSYRKSFTGSHDYALNNYRGNYTPYDFDGYRRGQAFNVGLSYEIGPFKTGISYFAAYSDKYDNRDSIVSWSNRVSLNKYLAVYLTGAYAEYIGKEATADGNRGYAFISGVELNI